MKVKFSIILTLLLIFVFFSFVFADKKSPKNPNPKKITFFRTNEQKYKEYKFEKDGSIMIFIPASSFIMGSPLGEGSDDEYPQPGVYLDAFYIDKYEVTNREYMKFVEATGDHYPEWMKPGSKYNIRTGSDDYYKKLGDALTVPAHPVVGISWNDAVAYCRWVGKRLPTEAEWEKAARGTDGRKYPWGNSEPDSGGFYRANWGEGSDHKVWKQDGYKYTAPAGSFPRGASPYGVMDMAGNVWEWCSDWYDETYYGSGPDNNPKGPIYGTSRVVRGGSWSLSAYDCRCATRLSGTPTFSGYDVGFRCAISAGR